MLLSSCWRGPQESNLSRPVVKPDGAPKRPDPGLRTEPRDGGADGDRTHDLRIANAALSRIELLPHEMWLPLGDSNTGPLA